MVLVLVVRLATLGETNDPALEVAIHAELQNELGNELGKIIEDFEPTSEEAVAAVLERADHENITLHSIRVSKPLLSSAAQAIVRLEYSLPGVNRRTEYWHFDHGAVAEWRYRYGSNAVFYYLNFI